MVSGHFPLWQNHPGRAKQSKEIVMAVQVAGELYYDLDGQLTEIKRQLRQPNGYPFDPSALKNALQDAIEGRFGGSTRFPFFNPATFIGKSWVIAEDNEALPETWDSASTRLVSALRKGEATVSGEKTIERLRGDKPLGARAFLYFWNNREKIPEEWKGKLVFFDATVLRNPGGDRFSLYLSWFGDRWYWYYNWLVNDRNACCVSACAS